MYACNKLDCPNECIARCVRCKIVCYCSTECQNNDWHIHKQMCFVSLSDRLRACCEITTKNNVRAAHLSFANGIHPRDKSTPFYYISCFPRLKLKSLLSSWCVVCSAEVVWSEREAMSSLGSYILFAGKAIPYLRCISCVALQRTLCHTTFMERAVCREKSIAKIIPLLMYRHCDALPLSYDVFNTIIAYAIDLLDCKSCLSIGENDQK